MRYDTRTVLLAALAGSSVATPLGPRHGSGSLGAREVPQEHSHEAFIDLVRTSLNKDNPDKIQDPIFALLGNAAAAAGAGSVTNLDCLQQATADQAFTNAKAAGDIPGMAGALVYRALERNTGSVGVASVICNETAKNPEIAALSQHQDPASDNAASTNKAITLELAKQLAGVGADPMLALESGTFAPGEKGDPTAAGNTCDDENDKTGCIFTQKLLNLDATPDEIQSAVAGIEPSISGTGVLKATHVDLAGLPVASGAGDNAGGNAGGNANATATATDVVATTAAPVGGGGGGGGGNVNAGGDAATTSDDEEDGCTAEPETTAEATATGSCTVITTTVAASVASGVASASATATATGGGSASGTNVQAFTGTLGGAPPPVISSTGDRPFSVNGDTFVNSGAALQRSCSVQHNACANAANSGALSGGVQQCEEQEAACNAANANTNNKKRQAGGAGDFGTCGTPTILFKEGLDGRQQAAFIAEDQTDFNHGSALNIGVIAGFICQRLGSPCGAAQGVIDQCAEASASAVTSTQDQSAADAFNDGLGIGAGAGAGGNGNGSGNGNGNEGAGGGATVTAAPSATATPGAGAGSGNGGAGNGDAAAGESSVVMTITQCS